MHRNLSLSLALLAVALFAAAAAADDSACIPGQPVATPTLHCIGIYWPVEGDLDADASCAVSYRVSGSDPWQDALPLHRKPFVSVDVEKSTAGPRPITFLGGLSKWHGGTLDYALKHWQANYLAGSIFNLDPGSNYEVRLLLHDPDGPVSVEKILRVATRTAPTLVTQGPAVTVSDDASLAAALDPATLVPGAVILLRGGAYTGPVKITSGGAPGKPVILRPASDDPVTIRGAGFRTPGSATVEITASFVHLHGLTFSNAEVAVRIASGRGMSREKYDTLKAAGQVLEGIYITRCSAFDVQHAFVGCADRCYVADNDLSGVADRENVDWSEGEGVEITGSATVVCHNRMRRLADAVSVYPATSDQDVYANDVSGCSDDGIELDYCDYNNRIWQNLFNFAGNNGISFQPHIGGPGYIIANQVIGFREGCIKDRYGSCDLYFFNNTFVGHAAFNHLGRDLEVAPTDLPMNIFSRNNLYLIAENTSDPVVDFRPFEVDLMSIDLDHDGFSGPLMIGSSNGGRSVDPALYPDSHYVSSVGLFITPKAFSEVSGSLKSFTMVDPATLFEVPLPPYRDWTESGPAPVMRLKKAAPAIDAGIAIPNVTASFNGAAPDLGALEYGSPEPLYGPRPAGAAPYEK